MKTNHLKTSIFRKMDSPIKSQEVNKKRTTDTRKSSRIEDRCLIKWPINLNQSLSTLSLTAHQVLLVDNRWAWVGVNISEESLSLSTVTNHW